MQHIRTWRAPREQDAASPAVVNEGLEQGLLLRADSADACSTDVDGASPSSSVQGGSSSSLVWLGSNQQIAALYGDGETESKKAQAKKALTAHAAAQSAQQEPGGTAWFARPARLRPPGAPAGSWPHTPWFVTVFYDPYERVNVWSHAVPGIALLLIGIMAWLHVLPGGKPLLVFGCCAATTHLLSAVTHIWPDDHFLEKIDHFGIVVLIAGTPLSALMAIRPEGPFDMMLAVAGGLLVAAMLPPVPRVVGFVVLGTLVPWRYPFLFDWNLSAQVLLNLGGAVAFLRNGGHNRPAGLQDHHILHYLVTVACGLHVAYIIHATSQHAAAALPQQPQQLLQL